MAKALFSFLSDDWQKKGSGVTPIAVWFWLYYPVFEDDVWPDWRIKKY